jgi:tetratricopeptide (TPR) repeat protein
MPILTNADYAHKTKVLNIHRGVWVCLFLAVSILAVYWQANTHKFVNIDDGLYVTKNAQVKNGLDLDGVVWAFKSTQATNWHPLTWLSHMLDVELYGLNAGAHHMSSVLLHIVNSLLLFIVFRKMTAHLWPSAFVAALFALHPLHVESVAWVAERKDVLSTFFWLLTMFSYARYAERPGIIRYLAVVACFMLGLMAKPMLVTLPFVLLLLDVWPLRRIRFERSGADETGDNLRRSPGFWLIWEKIPLFLLTVACSVLTFVVQQKGGAVRSLEMYPLTMRVANALVSYVKYIVKMIWPVDLAVFYPHPGSLPIWQVAGAGLFLALVSVVVLRAIRRRPWFAVGWLWYAGTLVPVIGLVQIGLQAMADRYTYVPLIGLFIMVAWGVAELLDRWRHKEKLLTTAAIIVLAVFSTISWRQVTYWKDSTALFTRTLDVTQLNYFAHNALGNALKARGQTDAALDHYYRALEIRPDIAAPHYNIGHTLAQRGKQTDAIKHFQKAIQIKPEYAAAHDHLGYAFLMQGKIDQAIRHYSEALRLKPDDAGLHNRIGLAWVRQGQLDQAIVHFQKAVNLKADFAAARDNLLKAQNDMEHMD